MTYQCCDCRKVSSWLTPCDCGLWFAPLTDRTTDPAQGANSGNEALPENQALSGASLERPKAQRPSR